MLMNDVQQCSSKDGDGYPVTRASSSLKIFTKNLADPKDGFS